MAEGILRRGAGGLARPRYSWTVFAVALLVYLVNFDVLVGNDAIPNTFLPVSILDEGNLSFTEEEMPFMFIWRLRTEDGRQGRLRFSHWEQRFKGKTARELKARGDLSLYSVYYYITPSRYDGIYVNTFGPGTGIVALPFIAAAAVFAGDDLTRNQAWLWYAAKTVASLAVAGSALLLYLLALRFVSPLGALVVTIAYALGTGVWSLSSQTLWQHGPAEFFLMLGVFCLSLISRDRKYAVYCGLALAVAVTCRPTVAVAVVAVGAYLLATDRQALWRYVLGGAPIAVLLFGYNFYYFGEFWDFGQIVRGAEVAEAKTGSDDLWQTPLWLGAAGLLISPSRGLLVFSPVMGFAFWGMARMWRTEGMGWLKPVFASLVLMWIVAFKWFDWWGGWSYGYRPIVDTMPLLAILLLPAIDAVLEGRFWMRALFAASLAWSIAVQFTGAFAYNIVDWNARLAVLMPGDETPIPVFGRLDVQRLQKTSGEDLETVRLNIDLPANRHRLWSIGDNQIFFYMANFDRARARKHDNMARWLKGPTR